jgi:hypothetical protein
MTPQEKAAQTARERRERRKKETAELRRDHEQAVAICRNLNSRENYTIRQIVQLVQERAGREYL